MNHKLEIYCELYKRGLYSEIPIGELSDGTLFYPTSKQVKALELINNDDVTYIGYGGSARSGKTLIECVAMILDCFSYDGIGWGLGRKELTVLKRTVLITLFRQFEFYGITDDDYTYNQQLNRIDFNNGSTIFFIDTADQPRDPLNTRFGGLELTRCAIDESNETSIEVINKLYERTGWRLNDKYGLKRAVFETFNPAKNHVHKRYWIPFRDNTEPKFKKFIQALPADNPHPSVQEWINDIVMTGDTITIERQINGNFDYDDDPSALCSTDAINDIFTNDVKTTGTKYISADLAMQGRDKFIAMTWNGLVGEVSIEQGKSSGRSIELSLKSLKSEKGVMNSKIVADSDGLGNYLESYIKNIKAFHGNTRSNEPQYANIKSECGFKLAALINKGEIRINCTPQQEELIKQELTICLKRDNISADTQKLKLISKDKMKQLLGHSPDFLDVMLMRMVFEVKKNKTHFNFV